MNISTSLPEKWSENGNGNEFFLKKAYNGTRIEKVEYYDPYLIHADPIHAAGVVWELEEDNLCDIDGVESPALACPEHPLFVAAGDGPDHHRGVADQQ